MRCWLAVCLLGLGWGSAPTARAADLLALPDPARLEQLDPQVALTLREAIKTFQSAHASATSDQQKAQAFAELGKMMHAHDEVSAADEAYAQALAISPDQFEWAYLRAMLDLGQGRVERALRGFDQTVSLQPDYAPAYIRRADLLFSAGKLDRAESDYRSALRLDGKNPAALAGLGQIALQRNDPASAIESLEQALRLQPEASRLRVALGLAYRKAGQLDKAREVLAERGDSAVWTVDPLVDALAALRQNPSVFFEQARALVAEGRVAQALPLLAKAVEMAPDDPIYLAEYGRQLHQQGRSEEADPVLARAEAADPKAPELPLLRGRVALESGDPQSAAQHFRRALALDPAGLDIRALLARVAIRNRHYVEAAEQFDYLAEHSESAEQNYAQYWSGLAHAMSLNCELAARRFQQVFDASQGRDGWAMFGLIRIHAVCPSLTQASSDKVAGWAEQLYRQHRGPETAEALAMLRAAAGDWNQAVALQSEALKLARDSGESLDLIEDFEVLLKRFNANKPADRAYSPHSRLLREN